MGQIITVLQIIVPIFAAMLLGMLARRRELLTPQQNAGLQQFVMQFGLPCVVFNSCYGAAISVDSLASMALVVVLVGLCSLWGFHARKRAFPYHNFPMLFSAQESGMIGIPLYIMLFGAAQTYHMGMLDLAQAVIAYPVIALLTTQTGKSPSAGEIAGKLLRSPLLLMSLAGLALNLSGAAAWLDGCGVGGIITETTGFIAQPVSAAMLFSVGYNFSVSAGNRGTILRAAGIHVVMFAAVGAVMQAVLLLLGPVASETRWAVLLYSILPASYLTPSMGRSAEEDAIASGVCSVLTIVTLLGFCAMAAVLV